MPTSQIYSVGIIFADAALELVPSQIWGHPRVLKVARRRKKRPQEQILDSWLHGEAISELPEAYRRGRPDILHKVLLLAQDSLLNASGLLAVGFHTYRDRAFVVKREWRPPRHYMRFLGLMEQLLMYGRLPPDAENVLVEEVGGGFERLVEKLRCEQIIGLSRRGRIARLKDVINSPRPCFVIGAFQKGFFTSKVSEKLDGLVALSEKSLSSLYVTARVIVELENVILF